VKIRRPVSARRAEVRLLISRAAAKWLSRGCQPTVSVPKRPSKPRSGDSKPCRRCAALLSLGHPKTGGLRRPAKCFRRYAARNLTRGWNLPKWQTGSCLCHRPTLHSLALNTLPAKYLRPQPLPLARSLRNTAKSRGAPAISSVRGPVPHNIRGAFLARVSRILPNSLVHLSGGFSRGSKTDVV
jgi:hypothetical protein